jgi:hypothetical protein
MRRRCRGPANGNGLEDGRVPPAPADVPDFLAAAERSLRNADRMIYKPAEERSKRSTGCCPPIRR